MLTMENEEQIREKLQQLLDSHSNDYNQILLLSNKLAEFDKEHVRFSIDGGLIDRLGNELVARQETAVSELVKNCYDADATHVTLTFRNTDSIGGELLIEDNGTGMTEQQLRDGFMRISSSEKIKNPVSAIYHRKRAGKKGIGRFSVQRLGRKLIIQTFTANANTGFELCIDWNSYAENIELGFVANTIKLIPKRDFVGTRLLIKDLRDRWPEASISRIYQYVSDVIQPHDIFRSKKENSSADIGMEVLFYLNNKNIHKEIHDLKLSYNQLALATIEGGVNSERHGYYHVYSDKVKLDFIDNVGYDTEDKHSEFRNIKNVKFKAYYFIYQKDLIPHGQMTSIKKYSINNSGIKLYRNGFRVLPYGERGDDWLSLDLSTRRRSILPTHTNQNFFGFVEISDDSGNFEETSSREGLLNNEAFVELQNFIYRALVNAVVKIAEVRNVKIVSGQKQKENGTWEDINVRIKNIVFTLSELDKELATGGNTVEAQRKRQKAIDNLKKEVDEVDKLQKKAQKKQIKDTAMLRVLGSVGLTVGQFIHEVKNHFISINKEVDLLNNVTVIQDVHQHSAILLSNFRDLNTYVSYFDKVISDNVVRELRPLDLRSEIGRFVNSMEEDLKRVGIELVEPIIHGYFLYTIPMHPSELSSVLFNFYTNSRKAIKRANSNGKIMIECGTSGDIVYLEFSDNGDGVSKEIEDRIFDEFFTTTSARSLDSIDSTNEVTGTGLGLSIVRDIVKSYRGTVRVVSPKSNYSTCIRVEFPKATKKHLQDYIYE